MMMGDQKYRRLLFRRKSCKRIFIFSLVFAVSFFMSVLIFGDLKTPIVMYMTDLHRCPACYGISVCPELYSNQIIVESTHRLSHIFNAKNIFYGYTKWNRRVVLKKLAHNWELKEFDAKLCETWGLHPTCKPVDLLNVSSIDDKILNAVMYNLTWPELEPRKGLILCPYPYGIYDFVQPLYKKKKSKTKPDLFNIWTMLSINPEPIILQVIPRSKGWPVPPFGGVCGRIEVLGYEGEPISSLMHVAWHRKLKFALKILDAAMDFTFKHDRYRFYLMDWSLDNIVVNEKDDVSFVDLEDVLVLDKHISPTKELPDWYQRYSRDITNSGFAFSLDNLCKYHLNDHNIWAACYILAGNENPLLYPLPEEVIRHIPHFNVLLNECLNGEDRFKTSDKLRHVMSEMLLDEKIVGFGAVSVKSI